MIEFKNELETNYKLFIKKNKSINENDLQILIINTASDYLLKRFNKKIMKAKNPLPFGDEVMMNLANFTMDIIQMGYIASNLYPAFFDNSKSDDFHQAVIAKISLEGTDEYLIEYFDMKISEIENSVGLEKELQEVLSSLKLSKETFRIINLINLIKVTELVNDKLLKIIKIYGIERLKHHIAEDSSDMEIATPLTHIIEIGGLQIIVDSHIKDSDLKDCHIDESHLQNKDNIQKLVVEKYRFLSETLVIVINCCLAIELKKLNIYHGPRSNYYSKDAMFTISVRLNNLIHEAFVFEDSFEKFAQRMCQIYL